MEGIRKLAMKNATIWPPADAPSTPAHQTIIDLLLENLALLLHFLEKIGGLLMEKLDEVFPPEARQETLGRCVDFALTFVLPVTLVLFCLYCCCCRRALCCCCCCCRRAIGKMMKAPGRRGARMQRSVFETDPRGYFLDLRAHRPLYQPRVYDAW